MAELFHAAGPFVFNPHYYCRLSSCVPEKRLTWKSHILPLLSSLFSYYYSPFIVIDVAFKHCKISILVLVCFVIFVYIISCHRIIYI